MLPTTFLGNQKQPLIDPRRWSPDFWTNKSAKFGDREGEKKNIEKSEPWSSIGWNIFTLGFQPPLKHHQGFNHPNWVNHYFNGGGSPGFRSLPKTRGFFWDDFPFAKGEIVKSPWFIKFTNWEPTNIHKLLLLKLFQDVSISSASFTPTIWNHLPFVPIMYGIFTYPYHKNQPNISKYIPYSTWILRGTTGLPSLNLTYSLKNWPSQKERIVSQPSIFLWPFVSIRICLHGIFTSIWLIFMVN